MNQIHVESDCVTQFNELKQGLHRFIIYTLQNSRISVLAVGSRSSTFDDFKKHLRSGEPCFAVYDYEYFCQKSQGVIHKFVFVVWVPDTSKIKQKMMYASSKSAFLSNLIGISFEIGCTDESEIDETIVAEKCATHY